MRACTRSRFDLAGKQERDRSDERRPEPVACFLQDHRNAATRHFGKYVLSITVE
jgi:hypothetical protein